MSGWFDSHCHVQEEYRGGGRKGQGETDLSVVLGRAAAAGVDRLVCIGTGATTSAQAVALAREVRRGGTGELSAWASVGLHPHEAVDGIEPVARLLAEELARGDGAVVAVGECGLDYFYEHSPRHVQRAAFAAQIALAHAHSLTLVIHARDAWDDLFDVLDAEGVPERTVLHCFTGGPAEVDRCLKAGLFVSFSGIITFKNAGDVRAAAALVPLDRLLVETDSPFLAPVPHRGRVNEPSYLPLVGAAVAEVKGCPVEMVAESSAAAAATAFCAFS
ncbi:MAG TPA: TatD family hydrolase [Acidimicrobiales bacterium]|nr:TatD family hydrolase [Acidimicrobiales bacterium]